MSRPKPKRGTTRSSLYRQIDRDPTLRAAADTLLHLKKGLAEAEVVTMASYIRMMSILGADPDVIRQVVRRSKQRMAAAAATKSKKEKTAALHALVLARAQRGDRQVEIARELNISTRYVRTLMHRKAEQPVADWSHPHVPLHSADTAQPESVI